MNNLVTLIAVLLIILWAVGFFACNIGAGIHIALVLAVISGLTAIAQRNKNHINN